MFERFTDRARRVVVLAQEEARLLNHNYIGTEHILLGLVHEGEGVAARALDLCDVSLEEVRAQVEEIIGTGTLAPSGHIPFTPRSKQVLELSLREALLLGHNYIGTEHILLALIREGEGVAAQVLAALGLELAEVRAVVVGLVQGDEPDTLRARPSVGDRRPGRSPRTPAIAPVPKPASCSFCGTPSPQAGQLFAGSDGALICERCVRSVAARLSAQSGGQTFLFGTSTPRGFAPPPLAPDLDELVAAVVPTGPPPDDEAAARAEIEGVFRAWGDRTADGRGLANVHDGDDLGPYLEDTARRFNTALDATQSVDAVVFVSPTEAVVIWSVALRDTPVPGLQRREGRAVLVEGRWMIRRETIAALLSYVGVHIPPRSGEPTSATSSVRSTSARPFAPGSGPRPLDPPFDALAARYEQTGPPPADEVTARAAVEAAFRNLNERTADGRGLENVEHGDELGAQAARVEDRVNAMAMYTVNVAEHVKFVDASHAVVWLTTMLFDGRPLLGPIRRRECRAVFVDGRWKVAYDTVRELWALADVQIPAPGDDSPST